MTANAKPLGLYLHIPFCKQKCIYCDFYSLSGNEGRMDEYTAGLCTHLKDQADSASNRPVDTVYLGGGTPSYLGEKRLTAILDTILTHYSVAETAEITLEANPDSAGDPAMLRALREAGFNRISLGMQSADTAELAAIGRIHTPDQVKSAVDAARTAGFDNLSLDLIYGLPNQTSEHWAENLAAAVALEPEHLSCYGLKVEEGTPLFVRRAEVSLPDDEMQADLYLYTVEDLARQGYRQYEISNFSRSGRESRHNLKYWTLGEYMGFGPGAHSDFGGVRYAYERDLSRYLQGVAQHKPPLSERNEIHPQDRAAEWIMLGLRTVHGLDPMEFRKRFGFDFSPFAPFLSQCRQAGYAVFQEGRWSLTPEGFLLSNQIIGSLLDCLATEILPQSHSYLG